MDPSEKYFHGNEAEATEEEISEFFEGLLTSSSSSCCCSSATNGSAPPGSSTVISSVPQGCSSANQENSDSVSSGETLTKQVLTYASFECVCDESDKLAVSFATDTEGGEWKQQVLRSHRSAPSLGDTSEERPPRTEDPAGRELLVCNAVSGYV